MASNAFPLLFFFLIFIRLLLLLFSSFKKKTTEMSALPWRSTWHQMT
jgi:hypothetical protein